MKTFLSSRMTVNVLPVFFWAIVLLGFTTVFTSCVGARFDQVALDNANTMGESVPALMMNATKSYSGFAAKVEEATAKINEAHKHALETPKNKEVAEMWRILRDDQVMPFFQRWKDKDKLDKDFVKPAAEQVKASLAAIERAERAKPK